MNSAGSTSSANALTGLSVWVACVDCARLSGCAEGGMVVPKFLSAGSFGEEMLIGLTTFRLDGTASGVDGTHTVSGLVGILLRLGACA